MGINQHKQLYGVSNDRRTQDTIRMIEEPLEISSVPNIHLKLVNRRSLKNLVESCEPKKNPTWSQKTKIVLLFRQDELK